MMRAELSVVSIGRVATTVEAAPAHVGVEERVARGKRARAAAPRSLRAEFEPAPDRPDPLDVLERQARTRVPELVPIRYGRMLVSPFTFHRGAAAIMAADLASTPVSRLDVQCCGNAHLSNFGVFASPDRRLVFDINDFDETHVAPWADNRARSARRRRSRSPAVPVNSSRIVAQTGL
jgi:hypothetical protein